MRNGMTETTDQPRELEVLRLLADGQFHSGEQLATSLGISRAAVWKRMERLTTLGIGIRRNRAKGYRLEHPLELLDREWILGDISDPARRALADLLIVTSTVSTNEFLMHLVRDGAERNGTVALAEHQSGGRGRRGRAWSSPFGCNLYLSLYWKFDAGVQALAGLSLVVGLGVLRALRAEFGPIARLKWPNDIVAAKGKLGGILIELEGDFSGPAGAVIGIGLNLDMPQAAASEIDQAWTDLRSLIGSVPSRNRLAARIIEECFGILAEFSAKGFPYYRPEWDAVDALRGLEVRVESASERFGGVACGVDDHGALQIMDGQGTRTVIAGDVSVRARS